MDAALPYHEPSIETVLRQSSFFLVLNAVNHVLDSWIYAGLVGQILVGIAWGTPGGQILDMEFQEVVLQLGYLGLILLVFEGGLSTSFAKLTANLWLSILVAATGIACPIGLSFVLSPLLGATPLQAFAAGAALCATSLGTTFTLLATSGLSSTRLGVILTSAAMMDDVVGLIMVQVIADLGASSSSFDAATVLRPVLVSLGLAIVIPLACRFIVRPVTSLLVSKRAAKPHAFWSRLLAKDLTALTIYTLVFVGIVAGATYAGSSALLGAYIAGAMISWWDADVPRPELSSANTPADEPTRDTHQIELETTEPQESNQTAARSTAGAPSEICGAVLFEKFYQPSLQRIFKPLFFASIGFSIPITQMFSGSIIWRGIVYTIPMIFGKLVCGLWLLRTPNLLKMPWQLERLLERMLRRQGTRANARRWGGQSKSNAEEKPLSVYPAFILGSAMVARGEIGYLIASLAEGRGMFTNNNAKRAAGTSEDPSDIFLVVVWAITLCTVAGPITMGLLVGRLRRLERQAAEDGQQSGRANVLGSWGVNTTPVS